VGFDPESDGHQIYWPDTRSSGIERSVTFEHREVMIPSSMPLEGENEATNTSGRASSGTSESSLPVVERPTEPSGSSFDPLGSNFEMPPPQPRRSSRQHFESDYLRRLREGEGTWDGRITLDYMKQLQENDSHTNSPNSRDNATLTFEEELAEDGNDSDLVYAMVARTSEAEGLDPSTVHEAKSRSDWSK
ncbi:hypothetical protein PISMIDRAFT_74503, partial [Pisolithus microcarpus 441]